MVDARDRIERDGPAKPFDTTAGYSGQDYAIEQALAEARRDPSGQVNPGADRSAAVNPPMPAPTTATLMSFAMRTSR